MSDEVILRLRRQLAATPSDRALQQRLRRHEERSGLRAPNLYHDPRRLEFLEAFPPGQRSRVANLFLQEVRSGASESTEVVSRVLRRLRRFRYARGSDERDRAQLAIVDDHREAALEYASWAIDWEQLPPAQRKELRREGEGRRRPPTPKQLDYLAGLGWSGDEPATLIDASDLIDALKRERGR